MKVLLIGGGGREDALAWAIARSEEVSLLRCAPGNAGIARRCELVAIAADDIGGLVEHVRTERYDLVVVGPEAPLVAGLADRLRQRGAMVFGPSAAAARIEGSKVFAKEFLARHRIPTASFRILDDAREARSHLCSAQTTYPLVVKADGLAAGKGVVIAESPEQAVEAAEAMLVHRRFGSAGSRIVVEEMLRGREASFFVLTDGRRVIELETCQDYKRAEDGDVGPNTGGMGSYSPSVFLDGTARRQILDSIASPTIRGLAQEGSSYCGVLYIGLMLTDDGPKVLEYNARFGDPETQVLLPRLDEDWVPWLSACASGELGPEKPRWKSDAAVCVVMTAGGYPGEYRKNAVIRGVEDAEALEGVVVFHAGTHRNQNGNLATSGGRVLGVTALGRDLSAARERAYEAVARIHWDGERHRHDIAADAVVSADGRSGP